MRCRSLSQVQILNSRTLQLIIKNDNIKKINIMHILHVHVNVFGMNREIQGLSSILLMEIIRRAN